MVPTNATAAPVSSETTTKRRSRNRSTRTPSALARSSPSFPVGRHASANSSGNATANTIVTMPTLPEAGAEQTAEQPEDDLCGASGEARELER